MDPMDDLRVNQESDPQVTHEHDPRASCQTPAEVTHGRGSLFSCQPVEELHLRQ